MNGLPYFVMLRQRNLISNNNVSLLPLYLDYFQDYPKLPQLRDASGEGVYPMGLSPRSLDQPNACLEQV